MYFESRAALQTKPHHLSRWPAVERELFLLLLPQLPLGVGRLVFAEGGSVTTFALSSIELAYPRWSREGLASCVVMLRHLRPPLKTARRSRS